MINIKLKDGKILEFEQPVKVEEVAKKISMGLYKNALAGKINGEVVDLMTVIDKDANLEILTSDDEGGIHALRHTASHILAQAVKRLYPNVKLAIGPAIDT
ncbi:MAG: thrS, partial [Clostridiales bacterium]|nr:thrS [Clostridiales bacterium]